MKEVIKDDFERKNILEPVRILTMTVLGFLPESIDRKIFLAFSGNNSNSDAKKVVSSAASAQAVEIVYTFRERQKNGQTKAMDNFWFDFLLNTRALRNRMILVKRIIASLIQKVSENKEAVNILSLGCGSTRAVLEVVASLSRSKNIFLKLIDINRSAIRISKNLAHSLNLDINKISWEIGKAECVQNYCCDFHPDIVEVVGLLDYFPTERAVNLISLVKEVIAPNGWLICGNIIPNLESKFVQKGIGWPIMIYRKPNELREVVAKGGFPLNQIQIVLEPLHIHAVAVAQKILSP